MARRKGPGGTGRGRGRRYSAESRSAEACVELALSAGTLEEALQYYSQGVAAGEREIGARGMVEYRGHFWGVLETRPYMRARKGLTHCLWGLGRRQEAVEHCREMLQLNPHDNQGMRYFLATLLLELDRLEELRGLLDQYAEDGSTYWQYTWTLLALRTEGESTRAEQLLAQARRHNAHVLEYLVGHQQLPDVLPASMTVGGADEAAFYALDNRGVWLDTPGAINWLRRMVDTLLPEPQPRRPSWAVVRPVLQQVPQQLGTTWQIDAAQSPGSGRPGDRRETPWVVLVVDRDTGIALGLDAFGSKPTSGDMWDCLTATMRKPEYGDPHRPARVEVRQKSLVTAWRSRLQQIDIECAVGHMWDVIDSIRGMLPKAHIDLVADEPQAAVTDHTDLRELPIEPDDVWQADIRRMPAWISTREGAKPYRPWIAMVVSRTHDLVLAYKLVADQPRTSWLWEAVESAIRAPMVNQAHRPGRIEVPSAQLRDALGPHTGQVDIACDVVESLETLDAALAGMARAMADEQTPPPLLEVPGMTRERVGYFFAAAAGFYSCKPWQSVPGDTPIKIECDKFQSGPWYAIVMGQSGIQQGLVIYEDEQCLRTMLSSGGSGKDSARGMSALTLLYSAMYAIPVLDLDASERYGWPVAGPEAYPRVFHVNPGCTIRPALVWELELLEGCLHAIPEFLAGRPAALTTCVPIGSGDLTLRLSWAHHLRR